MQPFPAQDNSREDRVVSDVCDLLHDAGEATKTKVKRWIAHVLSEANRREGPWWFLRNYAQTTLQAGNDVIDIKGHVDRIGAIWGPKRLRLMPFGALIDLRMNALADNRPNAGTPSRYALEAGRRVHLWPAPAAATAFGMLYYRPLVLPICSPEWEDIVLDGVLGLYGRHFDRDALTQDPQFFEQRFYRKLRGAKTEHHDVIVMKRWEEDVPATIAATADSATDTATSILMPASVTGVGYVTIETGDYPLEVG